MSLKSKSGSQVKKLISGQKVDHNAKMGLKSKSGSQVEKWVRSKSESGQKVIKASQRLKIGQM